MRACLVFIREVNSISEIDKFSVIHNKVNMLEDKGTIGSDKASRCVVLNFGI